MSLTFYKVCPKVRYNRIIFMSPNKVFFQDVNKYSVVAIRLRIQFHFTYYSFIIPRGTFLLVNYQIRTKCSLLVGMNLIKLM